MKSRRAGIELSTSLIVMLIIAIVVFSFGVKFVYDIVREANRFSDLVLDDLSDKMEKIMCDSSQRVCIGRTTKEIRPWPWPRNFDFFTLGILNTYSYEKPFYINVIEGPAYDIRGNQIPNNLLWKTEEYISVKPNTQERVPIAVRAPGGAKRGDKYILNVLVTASPVNIEDLPFEDSYGPTQIIQVIIT